MFARFASGVAVCLRAAGAKSEVAVVQRRLWASSAEASPAALAPNTHVHTDQGTKRDLEWPVYSLDGSVAGTATLPGDLFDVPIRRDVVHRVVRWQRAKKRSGNHKVKTRAEVNGSNRKPHAQKGSGRARQGTLRKAPHHRGGGVAHGPVVRSHAHDLPKKVRRLGLMCALSARAAENRLVLVDSLDCEAKTNKLLGQLGNILPDKRRNSALLVDGDLRCGDAIWKASGNLPGVELLPQIGLNVYSILRHDNVVLTTDVLRFIVDRLRAPIKR